MKQEQVNSDDALAMSRQNLTPALERKLISETVWEDEVNRIPRYNYRPITFGSGWRLSAVARVTSKWWIDKNVQSRKPALIDGWWIFPFTLIGVGIWAGFFVWLI
jgi:hypothetical protein